MFKPKLFTLLKNRSQEFTAKRIFTDINAGLIVAFIAVPLSIALAIASGVMPGKGLVTAVVAGFLISFFGGSRVQIGGPTGAFVIIVYGIIQTYGTSGLITATAMAGVFLILMGLLKFGKVIKYIPDPIIIGFTSGIAVVLFSTQINDFLGLGLTSVPSEFIAKWALYLKSISHISLPTLAIGAGSLLLMVFYPKKLKFFPAPLAAIILSTLIVKFFALPVDTIFSHFGDITNSMTFSPEMPAFSVSMMGKLFQPALTIALLAGIESLLSAVVADGMIGKKHNSNTELIAQGIANMGSAVFGGIPATGAIARTAANVNNGGRTPIAGIAHAVFILIIMLAFMQYISLIPMVTLAAILFSVAYRMVDFRAFQELIKAPMSDSLVLLITFFLTVFVDLVYAIEIGMILAALLFMKRMADITGVEDDSDDIYEGIEEDDIENKKKLKDVVVYEINGPFFFGAASAFIDRLEKVKDDKVIILRMRKVPAIDATGYHALYKIYKRCAANDTRLILCQVQKYPLKVLKKFGFTEIIGRENFALNINNAFKKAEEYILAMEEYEKTFHLKR
ncbi:SulP family inorganic anion transporter [Endomicrobium proavitum]|uniref:Sulfate permease n=1 Tax=Endomicrobium proavitum TaxID=1408281 RepID=A0A0G3WK84_9BACT|nr:SulP family inorganic anion transporter [Endomicrobium proavitum]AKL98310.1 Sulfate permease [Endomicrobium proavitum]